MVAAASGRVLEVGVGSGSQFSALRQAGRDGIRDRPWPRLLTSRAGALPRPASTPSSCRVRERIPLADDMVDTIVMTWTLCSITDPLVALREMRRVLKPGGKLLFVEHGLSPEPAVERWQHRLTPMWRHIAGGCHLDRKVDDLIRSAGFDLMELRTEYAHGPRPMTYMYEGSAKKPAI